MIQLLKQFIIVAILTLLGSIYACSTNDPPSVAGNISQQGRRVIAAGESVLTGIDQLVTSGVLSKEDATRIVTVIKEVGVQGERLSTIMLEVDSARDDVSRERGLRQAAEVLKLVQSLVVKAGSGIGSEGGRAKVLELLNQITVVVIEVAMLLPAS